MKKESFLSIVWKIFKKNRLSVIALSIVLFFFTVALLAPLIANNKPYIYASNHKIYYPILFDYPELTGKDFKDESLKGVKIFPPIPYSYSEYDFDSIVEGPSAKHILGTDEQGRDLAARIIHGTRFSMLVGFIAVFLYVSIGIVIGAIAGYYGGWVDIALSRFIEIVICFPTFFLILTILALLGPSLINVMIVIGVTSWTGIARLVRGEFLKYKNYDFVIATKAMGAKDYKIIFRHILPNALAPVFVSATFGIASTILTESSLSFLGFGIQPPNPSWGDILSQSREFMDFAWWLTLFPGLLIFLTITSYNLVGDGLQDAINPKSYK